MTDADVDGAQHPHAAAHLLLPPHAELLDRGNIFIAQPPLYGVRAARR